MKTACFILLLVAASTLAAPSNQDLEDAEVTAKTLLPKPTKPTKPPKPTKPTKPTTTPIPTTTEQATTTTEVASTLPPTIGDYELVGNFGYYKLYKKATSWKNAWMTCLAEDAHLLVVRTQEEYDALCKWKSNEMPPYVFYGGHHRFMNHQFVTIFDELMESLPYHKFGWDYSNTTYFNNKDFPIMIIDLSPSSASSDIYITGTWDNLHSVVCKKDIV